MSKGCRASPDIAKPPPGGSWLGFANPSQIRELIKRHEALIGSLGVIRTVRKTAGTLGGRPATAYYLNKPQAIFVTSQSATPTALQITAEVIRKFDEYERGEAAAPAQEAIDFRLAREARLQFRQNLSVAKLIGLAGNQAALAANRATARVVGHDLLASMGVTHLDAPQQEQLLNATDIGKKLGISPPATNLLLQSLGYQTSGRDAKDRRYWEPTEKGRAAGGVMQDTGKRHGDGTPVRQLRWASGIVDLLQANSDSVVV